MRVLVGFVALALILSFPASDARAQSPEADLLVVVLATVASADQRPFARLPTGFRDKSLYWRQVKSGDAVSYQLCLGFFDTRSDAERARQQLLAANFREARVFSVSPAERENLLNPVTPAPPAQAISPVLPPPTPAPPAQETSRALPPPTPGPSAQETRPLPPPAAADRNSFRPDLRVKLGGAAGIDKLEVLNIGTVNATQEAGGNFQVELVMTQRHESGVAFVGSVGLFSRQHNGKVQDPVLPTNIQYDAGGVSGSIGASLKANENLHFEGRFELAIGSGEPTLTTPGVVWNRVQSGGYSSSSLIFGVYYTITRPGMQIGLEFGSQSFVGNFQIWNNAGYWSDGKVSGSGGITNLTVGFRF